MSPCVLVFAVKGGVMSTLDRPRPGAGTLHHASDETHCYQLLPINLELQLSIIFHRNVEFENVLNIGWWLAAVSACGDPHDLCYLHDTAEGGPWPGQADHRTTVGCSALRGTRMIYLCSFIERPTFTLYRPIHIRSHYPHHSAAG